MTVKIYKYKIIFKKEANELIGHYEVLEKKFFKYNSIKSGQSLKKNNPLVFDNWNQANKWILENKKDSLLLKKLKF